MSNQPRLFHIVSVGYAHTGAGLPYHYIGLDMKLGADESSSTCGTDLLLRVEVTFGILGVHDRHSVNEVD